MSAQTSQPAVSQPQLQRTIRLHGMPHDEVPVVTAVALQPHGNLVATAGDDHVIRLWDVDTGRLVRELRGHQDWITAVSFCSDGSELITGSRDRTVNVWDVATGRRTGTLGTHEHPISSIVLSERDDRVAIAGFRAPLKVYDLASRKLLGTLSCACTDIRAVAFSSDMQFLAAGGRSGKLRVWDLGNGTKVDLQVMPRRIWSVQFTSENQLLAAGEDDTISLWNPTSGKLLQRFDNKSGKVLAIEWLDENQFAAASADNTIRLFELNASQPLAILKGHTGSIATLDYRDGTLLSGSFDTTVRVWTLPATRNRNDNTARSAAERTISTRIVPGTLAPQHN